MERGIASEPRNSEVSRVRAITDRLNWVHRSLGESTSHSGCGLSIGWKAPLAAWQDDGGQSDPIPNSHEFSDSCPLAYEFRTGGDAIVHFVGVINDGAWGLRIHGRVRVIPMASQGWKQIVQHGADAASVFELVAPWECSVPSLTSLSLEHCDQFPDQLITHRSAT